MIFRSPVLAPLLLSAALWGTPASSGAAHQEPSGTAVQETRGTSASDREGVGPPGTEKLDPFTDARVKEIESQLRCTCGCNLDIWTCQRQMQCGTSPGMSARVRERLAAGWDGERIIAEFVERQGQEILMAPPKEGFNWLGYLLPFVALAGGGLLVAFTVRRWKGGMVADGGRAEATPEPSARELARLDEELARLEEDLE